jgi:hypothetical protein
LGPHRAKPSKNTGIRGGNTGWLHVEYKGWTHEFIIALQDIPASEELTIDYGEGCEAHARSSASARELGLALQRVLLSIFIFRRPSSDFFLSDS